MNDPVKILFLSANPIDITRIRLDEEVREVDQRIQLGPRRDQLSLIPTLAVRPSDLAHALLRYQPHVLHFSGHGSATQGIVLEDNEGKTTLVATDALANLLQLIKDNLRVVVLNACFSGLQADAIQQVVDFTIVMTDKIGDKSAIVFSSAFYQGLAFGRSVKEAFGLGIVELKLQGIPGADTPRLLEKPGADASKTYLIAPAIPTDGVVDSQPADTTRISQKLADNIIEAEDDVNAIGLEAAAPIKGKVTVGQNMTKNQIKGQKTLNLIGAKIS
jgi:hypothetical protein